MKCREGWTSFSVAATVYEAYGYALFHHLTEATGVPSLNAQSPSQRSDGDCALDYAGLDFSALARSVTCNVPAGAAAKNVNRTKHAACAAHRPWQQ